MVEIEKASEKSERPSSTTEGEQSLISRGAVGKLLRKATVKWEAEHQLIELCDGPMRIWILTEFPLSNLVSQWLNLSRSIRTRRPSHEPGLLSVAPASNDIEIAVFLHKPQPTRESLPQNHPQSEDIHKFAVSRLRVLAEILGHQPTAINSVLVLRLLPATVQDTQTIELETATKTFCFIALTDFPNSRNALIDFGHPSIIVTWRLHKTCIMRFNEPVKPKLAISNCEIEDAYILMVCFEGDSTFEPQTQLTDELPLAVSQVIREPNDVSREPLSPQVEPQEPSRCQEVQASSEPESIENPQQLGVENVLQQIQGQKDEA